MANLRPTFSESWYRVANLKVRLRPSAQISRQHYRGERWYVVRDPAGNQFHRLSDAAYRFVGLLDGTRTVSEAWDLAGGHLADDAPTQPEVIQILSQLHAANLLEAEITPDAGVLLRRHKQQQQRQMKGKLMQAMFPRIPIWDCDRFLVRWMPVVRPFLSKIGAVLWLLVVIAAIAVVAPRWNELKIGANDAIAPSNWLWLWAVFVGVKFIHELGHAFACRRFGGEVHEMGILFLVFIPTPYVDASSAWSFPSKWARMFVGLGGMIVEIFFAAIMAFVWANTAEGTLIKQLAYNAMLIASVSTVLFNANPLLRYDGYYILSDWLEIPNLKQKSMEYTMGLIKRHAFGVKLPQPLPPIPQRIWLFVYAVTSGIYRIFIGIMIIILVAYSVPILGILMAIGGVITWLVVPVVKISKYLFLEPELHRKRGRAIAMSVAFAAAVFVLIGIVRFPVHVTTEAVIEPSQREILFMKTPGLVVESIAQDGQFVRKGDPIFISSNTELDNQIRQYEAELLVIEAQQKASLYTPGHAALIEPKKEAIQKALAEAIRRRDELTVRAPMDGLLTCPNLHNYPGKFFQQGEQVAVISTIDEMKAYAVVPKTDYELVVNSAGRSAEIRLSGAPREVIFGREIQYTNAPRNDVRNPALTHRGGGPIAPDPQDQTGRKTLDTHYELTALFSNPGGRYVPDQRAHLRLTLEEKPLLWVWGIRFMQLLDANRTSKWI